MNAQTSWSDLPLNIRQKITNDMCPESRSMLSQCSKQCEVDVKNSACYIDNLTLDLDEELRISVGHRKNRVDYYYVFLNVSPGKVLKKCFSHENGSLLYENEIHGEIDAEVFASRFWKQLMIDHADKVRELRLQGSRVMLWNFAEVRHFGRLESVYASYEFYVDHMMAKIQSTLKTVQIENELSSEAMSDRMAIFEEIYNAKTLILKKTIFTDYQFNRLTANIIEIPVGAITESCLIEFIRKWIRGDLRADFKSLSLGWPRHQWFNAVKVLSELGIVLKINFRQCRIKQTCPNAKEAMLTYSHLYHYFEFGFYVYSE